MTVMRSVSGKLAETHRNTQFISRRHSGFLPLKSAFMDITHGRNFEQSSGKQRNPRLDCAIRSARARLLFCAVKLNHQPGWDKSKSVYSRGQASHVGSFIY